MTQRERYIETAKKYVGCRWGDARHKRLLDLYNSHKPLARGYSIQPYDAWCQATVSAIAVECGLTDIIAMEVSCPKAVEIWKKMGCWVEDDGYRPKPGDIIYYDWQDSGVGDNTGNPDHVGIVTECDGKTISVLEGNINNGCGYRRLDVNGRYIRGFAVPKYKDEPIGPISPTDREKTQKRFGFDNNTMAFLDGHPYRDSLYQKLANMK